MEEKDKALEKVKESISQDCPHCGKCPTCGRGGYTPYIPYAPYTPYPWYPHPYSELWYNWSNTSWA